MSIVFALAIYFIIWWIVLFAVLPFGVRTQADDGEVVPGTPHSAPTQPQLKRIFIATTAVSLVVFGLVYAVIVGYLGVRLGLPLLDPPA